METIATYPITSFLVLVYIAISLYFAFRFYNEPKVEEYYVEPNQAIKSKLLRVLLSGFALTAYLAFNLVFNVVAGIFAGGAEFVDQVKFFVK